MSDEPNTHAGDQDQNWLAELPEDIRNHPSLSSIQNVGALAKSYVHAQSMIGTDKIVLPGPNATEEEWAGVYAKLGRPESVDKYQLTRPKDMPEGAPYSEEVERGFLEHAHAAGLSNKQVQHLYDWYMQANQNVLTSTREMEQARVVEAQALLKQEYGQALPQALEMGRRVIAEMGSPELMQMVESGLGNDPNFIKFVVKIGQAMGEDKFKSVAPLATPADAQRQISQILGDKAGPYWDRDHPDHQNAVREMARLHEQAYPST